MLSSRHLPGPVARFLWALALAASLGAPAPSRSEEAPRPKEAPRTDLSVVKQEEARQKLQRLEETMDQLSRILQASEPQNAAKLRLAFQAARERLLREGMDKILDYLREKKLDQAIEEQAHVKVNLEEILDILLEKDIDPRELLKEVQRLRDIVKDLDRVVQEETAEKMASDDAHQADSSSSALSKELEKLEDLIRKEKALEKETRDPATASGPGLGKLAPAQAEVRGETARLREADAAREKPSPSAEGSPAGEPGKPGEPGEAGKPGESGKPGPESGSPEKPAPEAEPPPPKPESVLDKKSLEKAEEAMTEAEKAMQGGDAARAQSQTTEARAALEEAVTTGKDRLERLKAKKDFPEMKDAQDGTKKSTDDLEKRMQKPPPLFQSNEEGVPGRSDVKGASEDMGSASQSLSQESAGKASKSQGKAVDKLQTGRQKAEETLEELQRALRDRILAYLREKFTAMLSEQRLVTRDTRSLDLKLRALQAGSSAPVEIDRKDRQVSEALATRENGVARLADDVLDLLSEDGTTLVFPGVVGEIKDDIVNVAGLLSRIQTGERTQYIQSQIEKALEEILKAIEMAQRSPPPPNPSQGRQSRSGAGPLLPLSVELKLVRTLQLRVNERTQNFDLQRKPDAALDAEDKLQLGAVSKKQKEVEGMLRKLGQAAGEK